LLLLVPACPVLMPEVPRALSILLEQSVCRMKIGDAIELVSVQ
jgi:hypothetical protein